MTRWFALVVAMGAVVGCLVPAGGAGGGAPGAPGAAPGAQGASYATVTSSDDPAGTGATPTPVEADPFADRACPDDLSLAAGDRRIDGRRPMETIKAHYAKEHMKPVKPAELIAKDDAIDQVIALETATPGVVPAGFRDQIAQHGRDPRFRLYMARCELTTDETTRRAGDDAGLAFLLGAEFDAVWPLVHESFYPDGNTVMSCNRNSDCYDKMKCDRVEKVCRSKRDKTASFLSASELDVEDVLVRAYAALLTPEMIENDRYQRDDLIGTWTYARFIKCSGNVVCNVTRYTVNNKLRLVHWDLRYQGESYGGASEDVLTGDAKVCFDHTESADLGQCTSRCENFGETNEAGCKARCYAWCK